VWSPQICSSFGSPINHSFLCLLKYRWTQVIIATHYSTNFSSHLCPYLSSEFLCKYPIPVLCNFALTINIVCPDQSKHTVILNLPSIFYPHTISLTNFLLSNGQETEELDTTVLGKLWLQIEQNQLYQWHYLMGFLCGCQGSVHICINKPYKSKYRRTMMRNQKFRKLREELYLGEFDHYLLLLLTKEQRNHGHYPASSHWCKAYSAGWHDF
jgi:hypothetical protein